MARSLIPQKPLLYRIFFFLLICCPFVSTALVETVSKNDLDALMHEPDIDIILAAFGSSSPSCLDCAKLTPELERAAAILEAKNQTTAAIVSVDCATERDLCHDYDINAYPALRIFKTEDNGVGGRYRGARKSDAISSFLIRQSLPPLTILDSSTHNSFKSISDTVFIAYLSQSTRHNDLQETFSLVANSLHNQFAFGLTTDTNIADQEDVDTPSIICHQPHLASKQVFRGSFTKADLEKIIAVASKDLIPELTRRNIDTFFAARKPLFHLFVATEAQRRALKKKLRPVAQKYANYVNFVTVDAEEYGEMALSLGLGANHWPAAVLAGVVNDQVYPMVQRGRLTSERVEKFVLGILEGKTGVEEESAVEDEGDGEDEEDIEGDEKFLEEQKVDHDEL